jgi:phage tail protein X
LRDDVGSIRKNGKEAVMKYTTKQGDMHDGISYALYHNEKYMQNIIESNIQHVGIWQFFAGVELDVPDTIEEMGPNLPPWRAE